MITSAAEQHTLSHPHTYFDTSNEIYTHPFICRQWIPNITHQNIHSRLLWLGTSANDGKVLGS